MLYPKNQVNGKKNNLNFLGSYFCIEDGYYGLFCNMRLPDFAVTHWVLCCYSLYTAFNGILKS